MGRGIAWARKPAPTEALMEAFTFSSRHWKNARVDGRVSRGERLSLRITIPGNKWKPQGAAYAQQTDSARTFLQMLNETSFLM